MTSKRTGGMGTLSAVHLRLEIKDEHLDDMERAVLRQYGGSSTGDAISRNILIPSDMPLHNLHYAIQRLFGWHNSHLRRFILPGELYNRLTGATVKGWADLVGILFQPPSECEHALFWDDDYQEGSIRTWLKKKYTGPYSFQGSAEDYEWAQDDVRQLMGRFPMVEVKEPLSDYMNRRKVTNEARPSVVKRTPLVALTLEEMRNSLMMDCGTESLLERLEVAGVLAFKDEAVGIDHGSFPVTHKLIYNYDFGDDWTVAITKERAAGDLLQKGHITEDELSDAEATVLKQHRPVCIHKDGAFVLDDVGGLHGFISFLREIHEGEERSHYLTWAQSQGWNQRKISNKLVL